MQDVDVTPCTKRFKTSKFQLLPATVWNFKKFPVLFQSNSAVDLIMMRISKTGSAKIGRSALDDP